MIENKGYMKVIKLPIYPNAIQKDFLNMHFGCCRMIYNLALSEVLPIYQKDKNRRYEWYKKNKEIKEEIKANPKADEKQLREEKEVPDNYDDYCVVDIVNEHEKNLKELNKAEKIEYLKENNLNSDFEDYCKLRKDDAYKKVVNEIDKKVTDEFLAKEGFAKPFSELEEGDKNKLKKARNLLIKNREELDKVKDALIVEEGYPAPYRYVKPPYFGSNFSYNGHEKGGYKSVKEYRNEIVGDEGEQFLKEVDSLALYNTLNNLAQSFDSVIKRGGEPRFKKRNATQAYETSNKKRGDLWDLLDGSVKLNLQTKKLLLPKFDKKWKSRGEKPGWISVGISSEKLDLLKNNKMYISSLTVKKNPSNKYYVSMLCYFEKDPYKMEKTGKSCGVSFSFIDRIATNSDNLQFFKPDVEKLRRLDYRINLLNQKLSLKQGPTKDKESGEFIPPSVNYLKTLEKINKLKENRANIIDFNLHCISKQLVKEYDNIYLQGFDSRAVSQVMKAKNEEIANDTIADYNKMLLDANIGDLKSKITYKAKMYEKNVHEIDSFYPSSKTCSCCGEVIENKKEKEDHWTCPKCGAVHETHLNSAKNVFREGENIKDFDEYEKEKKERKKSLEKQVLEKKKYLKDVKDKYNENVESEKDVIEINDGKINSLAVFMVYEKDLTYEEIIKKMKRMTDVKRRNRNNSQTGRKRARNE